LDRETPDAGGDFMHRLSETFARIAGWSFDHRGWVVALALAMLIGSLGLAGQARIDSSYETFFNPGDSTYVDYEQYRDAFGSDEITYILYSAPGVPYGPWNIDVMRRIVGLTEALEEEVPFVYEVDSLANAELMVGGELGIEIRELRDEFPETQEELLALRDQYLAKPMFVGGILSSDAEHAAIIMSMDRSSTDPLHEIRLDPEGGDDPDNLYPQVTDAATNEILARPEYADIVFHQSGDVPLNTAYNVIIADESMVLDMITAAVIALLLAFFFRSWVGMLAPVVVVQLSVIATVAFVVLVGWQLDMTFAGIPTLMTAIGVAHSVHILSEFRSRFALLRDRREALVETLRLVGTPCLLASVTTAVGFASMSVSPIKALHRQGIYAGFGVIAAFVLSLTLLLALLSFGRRTPTEAQVARNHDSSKGGFGMHRFLAATAELVIGRRIALIVGFGVVFAFSIAGMMRMHVDSNWLNDFSDRVPLKRSTLVVDDVMGGVTNLVLLFDSGEAERVKEPAVLAEIERIQQWAGQFDIVRKSYSIVDVLKDLNQTFNEDDRDFYVLPGSRELVAQYLVLYESAGGTEADELVTSDYRTASLELRIALAPISETMALVDALHAELDRTPLQATELTITGIGALWLKLTDYIVSSQVNGFLIAFAVIGLILCLLFRSARTGVIAMIPNLSPVLLTLGIIGWLDIPLDYNKVLIAAVALGIAVDDTIHLMSRIRFEFMRLGSYREAIRAAMTDVGRAVLITSIALVFGFLVLLASVLDSNGVRGILLATTIVFALIADFLLMPSLILTFEPFGPEGARASTGEPDLREAA
jgi:predicted RND superfamily exporter protein